MLAPGEAVTAAGGLMRAFAERTGLSSGLPPRRYLWTDAFAVCNFLALARATGDGRWAELALKLLDQVHHVLGRHRPGGARSGWISGLDEREGEAHPTRGGLRIGKALPERAPEEPFDERLEWERDGQYFSYLTKWMHALDQVARARGEGRFNLWARELAQVAHQAFVRGGGAGGPRRMAWKMSTDLSRPLVASMGQHDPLDGFLTCLELEDTAARLAGTPAGPALDSARADFAALLAAIEPRTADPLGLGGLLADAGRLAQLGDAPGIDRAGLLEELLAAAQDGLPAFFAGLELRGAAEERLAFRELGLAIGLSAVELLRRAAPRGAAARAAELAGWAPRGHGLVSYWLAPERQRVPSWTEHRDINEVMLATSLVPEGFLVLAPARQSPNG